MIPQRKIIKIPLDSERNAALKIWQMLLEAANQKIRDAGLRYEVMLKGGTLREILEEIHDVPRMSTMKTDVDIILTFSKTFKKEMEGEDIFLATDILQEVFAGLVTNEDIETVPHEGKPDKNGIPKMVRKIILSRDMGWNELVLRLEDGQLVLYHSDVCLRHIKGGIGMLSPGNSTTMRIDRGEMVALPQGAARLIRMASKKALKKIHLPQKCVDALLGEADGKEPLGVYGLINCLYFAGHPAEQKNMMKLLLATGLTQVENFADYEAKLRKEYSDKNKGVEFHQKKRTFREVLEARRNRLIERETRREQRKDDMGNCPCPEETLVRDILPGGFRRTCCPSCGGFNITDMNGFGIERLEILPSNQDWILARETQDLDFFYVGYILATSTEEIVRRMKNEKCAVRTGSRTRIAKTTKASAAC